MIHAPTNLSKARFSNSGEIRKASLRHRQNNLDLYTNLPDRIKVQILEKSSPLQIPANASEEKDPKVSKKEDKRAKKQGLRMKADMEEMKLTYDKKHLPRNQNLLHRRRRVLVQEVMSVMIMEDNSNPT
jgi:hypothetical protein